MEAREIQYHADIILNSFNFMPILFCSFFGKLLYPTVEGEPWHSGKVVALPCDHEVMGLSPGNSHL
jgi:hypothetical protein